MFAANKLWRPVVEPEFRHGQQRFLTNQPDSLLREGKFAKVNILTGTADEISSTAQSKFGYYVFNDDFLCSLCWTHRYYK